MTDNYFIKLAEVDVRKKIREKGQFKYLSWVEAVKFLRSSHPAATWNVKKFNDQPFMKTDCGYFVEVEVCVNDVCLSQIHPVLDNRNKPIESPNSFQINTAIQRCLAKAIALHGPGLSLYSGEDILDMDQYDPMKIKENELSNRLIDDIRLMFAEVNIHTEKKNEIYNAVRKEFNGKKPTELGIDDLKSFKKQFAIKLKEAIK